MTNSKSFKEIEQKNNEIKNKVFDYIKTYNVKQLKEGEAEYLANQFNTTTKFINGVWTQYKNELKSKKRKAKWI